MHYTRVTGCKQTTTEGDKVEQYGAIGYDKDLRPICRKYISQNRMNWHLCFNGRGKLVDGRAC